MGEYWGIMDGLCALTFAEQVHAALRVHVYHKQGTIDFGDNEAMTVGLTAVGWG